MLSRNNSKILVKKSMSESEKEMYERSGLWFMLKLFHYFGFRLLNDPARESCVNWVYVSLVFALNLITYATSTYLMVFSFIKSDGSWDTENAGLFLVVSSGYSVSLVNWVLGVSKAKEYSVLLRSLVSAVDAIPQQERKQKVVRQIKKYMILYSIPCIICEFIIETVSIVHASYFLKCGDRQTIVSSTLYLFIISTTNGIWLFTIGAFYFFTNACLLTVCSVIKVVTDIYLKSEEETKEKSKDLWNQPTRCDVFQEEDLIRTMDYHKKMSMIVEKANSAFAHFLLFTLTIEIMVSIAFVKMLTMKEGTFTTAAYDSCFNTLLLVLKACACAKVNDNLKSAIIVKKFPDSTDIFSVNCFILYQNEQQINRAEITYGNIFPVRKSFIFTIAGTALTYALVLQGV